MGSACTKSSETQVLQPQNEQDLTMHRELSPFLSISHQFNVNHKYSSFCTYIKNEFTGQGIKKTHAYKSKLTKEELILKRSEFWDTRVEGYKHCWQILQQAVEANEKDALAILAAGGMRLINKSIQISYDESFRKYDIPIFCLNDPVSYETVPTYEKNINKDFEEKEIKVMIRCPKMFGKDIAIQTNNSIQISDLKQLFNSQTQKNFKKIRFFISGRELYDHHKLGFYNFESDQLITSFAFDNQ